MTPLSLTETEDLLGGFTTFSTFTYETVQLWRDAQYALGLANILVQVLAGVVAVLGGYALARTLGGG